MDKVFKEYQFEERSNDNQLLCSICLDEYGSQSQNGNKRALVQSSSCKHVFHQDCIQIWIKQKVQDPYCPMCKGKFADAAE